MPTKNAIGAVAVAALLVLAGCSSAVPGSTTQAQATTDGTVDDGGSTTADATDLTFYVSDRPGAIEDFEHLNVTITKIGLREAGDDADDDEAEDTEADDTESANDTTASDANAALDSVETTTVDDPNETTVDVNDTETETEDSETEKSEEADSEASEDDDSDEKDGWVTHDVDDETVDLTKLKGANATAIGNVSVPGGEYDKVFVYVSDVNATLKNGESVNVKLPSSKLQINKAFTISKNSSPDFVFDINVHKAGNSGKYILRPIVSESGTGDQVEIRKVDKNGKPENPGNSGARGNDGDDGDDEEPENDEREDDARALEASLDGEVRAGETVTLSVTDANGSVANATVEVNGEIVGETGVNGTLAFEVPDTDELEVEATAGDAEVELEREIKAGKGGNGNGNGGGNDSAQRLSGHALAAI